MSASIADLAVRLPWLAPDVAALKDLATARDPLSCDSVRNDPATILLLLRSGCEDSLSRDCRGIALRSAIARLSRRPAGVITFHQVIDEANGYSRGAFAAAEPALKHRAAILSVLRSLGKLAVAAVDSEAIARVFSHPRYAVNAEAIERKIWGASNAELSRRLARRWKLPRWCQDALAQLDHAAGTVTKPGKNAELIETVRNSEPVAVPGSTYRSPYDVALLPELLRASARNYLKSPTGLIRRLERENDHLHSALTTQVTTEDDRLRERKIVAVAEFAAGAGHEINTPLAIISGQAQYLLAGEVDPARRKALSTVVHQAHRVHEILTDLMQFARPGQPEPQLLDLSLVVRDVSQSLVEQASLKDIRLECQVANGFLGHADPRHVRTALHCLVRNALDATPSGGWIRLRGDGTATAEMRIVVEDSGPGVDPLALNHLFDPFFSGRSAGRGRGLGLPTAWRLARASGGDVRFLPGSPTAFVLALPRVESIAVPGLLSA